MSQFATHLFDNLSTTKSNLSFDTQSLKNNEKLTDIISTLNKQIKNLKNENLELKKDLLNQSSINSLETTIKLQREQLDELNEEEMKNELKLEEATTVLNDLATKLENSQEKLQLLEGLYNELKKPTQINDTEMFRFPPREIYEMYKKQLNLFKKQSNHVKNLLEEKKTYRQNMINLKNENEELRLKIVNLTENDIEKRILNFTIDENKRLQRKINIQKERSIDLGLEFREGMKKVEDLEFENKKLLERLKNMENNKIQEKEEVLLVEKFHDDGWETCSEHSLSEDVLADGAENSILSVKNISIQDSTKKSSPKIKHSNENGILKIKITHGESNEVKNSKLSPKNKEKTNQENSSTTGKSSDRPYTPVTKKKICRFHLQQRCKFGDRCFNIHTSQNAYPRKYVPPWKNDRYPSNYNYQSSSSYVPDLALYGGYLSQNRFQKLPLMDLDLGEHSVYWSRPYNPTLKNSSNQNFPKSLNHPNFMH